MPIRDPSLTPESIRAAMAIPSTPTMRGLKDGIGFATTPEQMAAVVAAASSGPMPLPLGPIPEGPWIGAICPHDDYLYAGRIYERALAGITADTVIVVGTFHGWRKFESGFGVFDTYESWFAPDGPVRVSPLRDALPEILNVHFDSYRIDNAAFDQEHSIEPIVAWLKHQNPDVTILPVLPPSDERGYFYLAESGLQLGHNLLRYLVDHDLQLGRDVAVVISADAIHYGPDFGQTRYGEGKGAYEQAVAEDLRILRHMLTGHVGYRVGRQAYETFVDPEREDRYRWTWCGRYAIPYGLHLLQAINFGEVRSWPLTYATSLDPPLDVHMPPLGFTAPASYDHFVGYPAVAFTFAPTEEE